MNRNAAILGLASSAVLALALGLAWSWRGTSAAEVASSEDGARSEPSSESATLLLDQGAAESTSGLRTSEGLPRAAPRAHVEGSAAREVPPDQDPLLLAGHVVDQDRSPIPRAVVTVGAPGRRPGTLGVIVDEVVTDARGYFEIHGTTPDVRPVARATRDGYYDSPVVTVAWGAKNVQLVLREGGYVAGRVQLDPWIPASKIRITVQPVPAIQPGMVGHGETFASPPLRLDAQCGFRFGGITEPTAVVSVRIENDPWEAARIKDVPVREGNAPQDSRLDPIDLRGKFEAINVDVVDESGAKLDLARVLLHGSEDASVECSRVTSRGRAEFLTSTGPHDIEVELDGFRHARLAGVYGDQIVRLRKGISVRIVLQGKSPDVKPPERIAIALLQGTRDRSTLGGMGTFVDPRETTIPVTSPGSYEIAWYLESGRDRKYITSSAGRTIEVGDLDGVQDVVVEFPSEALAAMR